MGVSSKPPVTDLMLVAPAGARDRGWRGDGGHAGAGGAQPKLAGERRAGGGFMGGSHSSPDESGKKRREKKGWLLR